MQQDAEDDEQDSDNEFPESDEMNQLGFSGEKSKFPRYQSTSTEAALASG